MATAHLHALSRAPDLGYDKFIITANSPFHRTDLELLRHDPAAVVKKYYPEYESIYERLGWKMFSSIDRVYRNDRARDELGWNPLYGFESALECLERGDPIGSDLARLVGAKGYGNEATEDVKGGARAEN